MKITLKKKFFILFILIFVTIFIGNNLIYPYSYFSFVKSFSYDANNKVVDQYKGKLTQFKSEYEDIYNSLNGTKKMDLTTDRIQYILRLYDQPSFISKEPTTISIEDLDTLLFRVEEIRELVIELSFQENYSISNKRRLQILLESTIGIEEKIEELKKPTFYSRETLSTKYKDIHVSVMLHFNHLTIFFREYTKENH
ncbi:hypothetical protein [Pseudalkalibacillus sp. SCS-8]|uniref:hypothetical protein n=1 Tax=Pseudalkalibacillus nanhaiensis TaxID=3115291 RepID=UPI0032DB70D9